MENKRHESAAEILKRSRNVTWRDQITPHVTRALLRVAKTFIIDHSVFQPRRLPQPVMPALDS